MYPENSENMDTKAEYDSSSSDDDVCMEAIKEAANQYLLKNLFVQAEGQKSQTLNSTVQTNDLNDDQYLTHGLSQSCRNFIAKKLIEKLEVDIVLEDVKEQRNNGKNVSREPSGIKLFNCSNIILTEAIDNDDDEPKQTYKKKVLSKFDEKKNFVKCKEVAIDSETIVSQNDVKFWVNRKHGEEFKYRKSKNGVLIQIK